MARRKRRGTEEAEAFRMPEHLMPPSPAPLGDWPAYVAWVRDRREARIAGGVDPGEAYGEWSDEYRMGRECRADLVHGRIAPVPGDPEGRWQTVDETPEQEAAARARLRGRSRSMLPRAFGGGGEA